MNWNDGLKLRPVSGGGVYVLICPSEGGVELKLGQFDGKWMVAGQPLENVIYFCEVDQIPQDAAQKGAYLATAQKEYMPVIADQETEEQGEPIEE